MVAQREVLRFPVQIALSGASDGPCDCCIDSGFNDPVFRDLLNDTTWTSVQLVKTTCPLFNRFSRRLVSAVYRWMPRHFRLQITTGGCSTAPPLRDMTSRQCGVSSSGDCTPDPGQFFNFTELEADTAWIAMCKNSRNWSTGCETITPTE